MKILSLCDFTGNMIKPWAEAGHKCTCVDIQHAPGIRTSGNVRWISADVRTWNIDDIYDLAFAFPPCTNLAVSGARWFKVKGLRALAEAIETFGSCVDIVELVGKGFVENPVSTISTYYRKPDVTFDPCDYGDPWTKKTCLWIIGDFIMPQKCPVEITMPGYIHRLPPSPERANKRSATPTGFARAVYESNQEQTIKENER